MVSFVVLTAAPRPRSPLQRAAARAADTLAARLGTSTESRSVDLADFGPALLATDTGREVAAALETVRDSDVLLVASPQVHGSYTGLLKAFADLLPELGLGQTVAVPMVSVADPRNGRNTEEDVRVLLSELGAWVAEPGLVFSGEELAQPQPVIEAWAEAAVPELRGALSVEA
ncbi:FMN reductase [Haloactinospora alba]|uniref:FMN reductase n=1 Tax=Haloactinospora alba TaxID=405555 RepID=A0A543NLQ6_9ACTN|nr:NAD(P)H-dependent oxidoreductase [Haloactinospora alba]TQN32737.1 FMN reductase [Haloactinospora alba]